MLYQAPAAAALYRLLQISKDCAPQLRANNGGKDGKEKQGESQSQIPEACEEGQEDL